MNRSRLRRSWFCRFFLWLFRRSKYRLIHNIRVAVSASSSAEATAMLNKMEAALDLVLQYDSRAMQVLRTQSDGIFVFGTAGVYAEWHRNEKLVVLQPEYVSAPATSAAGLASTLVHEATHACLKSLGFGIRRTAASELRQSASSASCALSGGLGERRNLSLSLNDNSPVIQRTFLRRRSKSVRSRKSKGSGFLDE